MDVAGDHMPGVSHRPLPAEPSTISPWYNWQDISAHQKSPFISQWNYNGIIFPFIVTFTPRWCKYCCISGRGDGALRRHFCQSHYTSDNLPTSTLGLWVHGERPTDDMIRDVGVALARKCCCAGNPSSHYSSSPIFSSLPTLSGSRPAPAPTTLLFCLEILCFSASEEARLASFLAFALAIFFVFLHFAQNVMTAKPNSAGVSK